MRVTHTSSSERCIELGKQCRRNRTAFINNQKSDTQCVREEFVHIAILILPLPLPRCRFGIDRDNSPGIDCLAANKRCHRILLCKKLELHSILPFKTLLEEEANQLYAVAFPCTWYAQEAITDGLAKMLIFLGHESTSATELGMLFLTAF